MIVHVEDAKSDASICQIPTNGHFYSGEAVIG
jgi:hypothetical protein